MGTLALHVFSSALQEGRLLLPQLRVPLYHTDKGWMKETRETEEEVGLASVHLQRGLLQALLKSFCHSSRKNHEKGYEEVEANFS